MTNRAKSLQSSLSFWYFLLLLCWWLKLCFWKWMVSYVRLVFHAYKKVTPVNLVMKCTEILSEMFYYFILFLRIIIWTNIYTWIFSPIYILKICSFMLLNTYLLIFLLFSKGNRKYEFIENLDQYLMIPIKYCPKTII